GPRPEGHAATPAGAGDRRNQSALGAALIAIRPVAARLGRFTRVHGLRRSSRARRGPPGHKRKTKTHQTHHYQRERYRAPPVLPEGTESMGAHAPGPEDAEQQEDGADNQADPTHDLKVSPRRRPRQERHAAHARRARGERRDRPLSSS